MALEGTGQRNNSVKRAYREPSLNVKTTTAAVENSKLIAQDTFQADAMAPMKEFAAFNQTFDHFFGQLSKAGDMMANVDQRKEEVALQDAHMERRAGIEQANQEEKAQGINDAITGKGQDGNLSNDLDYTNAYKSALGARVGGELTQEFLKTRYLELRPGDNFDKALQDFATEKLKNGQGVGYGDPLFDNAIFKSLMDGTRGYRASHTEAAIKDTLARGLENDRAAISTNFDSMTALDLPDLYAKRSALMPLAPPGEAKATVIQDLMATAGNNPQRIQRVMSLLDDPRSGDGTASFRQLYPEGYQALSDKAHARYQSGLDIQGQQIWDGVDSIIDKATDAGQLTSVMNSLVGPVFSRHGGNARYQSAIGKINYKLTKLMEETVTVNRYQAIMSGAETMDAGFLKSNQRTVMSKLGINPLADPEGAAQFVVKSKVMGEDLKVEMSSALTDYTSPENFAKALRFYSAIDDQMGNGRVNDMLNGPAKAAYAYARNEFVYNHTDPTMIAMRLQSNIENFKALEDKPWNVVIKEPTTKPGEAEEKVRKRILSTLKSNDALGERVELRESTMQEMLGIARSYIATGMDWKKAVDEGVKGASRGLSFYPGDNGKLVAGPTMVPKDKDYVPFGTDILNPKTGIHENTLKTWDEDARGFSKLFKEIESQNGERDMSLDANSKFAKQGLYPVKTHGEYMIFGLGQEYSIYDRKVDGMGLAVNKRTFSIPEDPHSARLMLEESPMMNHERFKLVPFPEDGSSGFMLVYKPGFVNKAKSVTDKEAEYAKKK